MLGYFLPQALALGTIGAFWDLKFLACLAFLAPWPSPSRAWSEFRAYSETYRVHSDWGLVLDDEDLERCKERFRGWGYYRMVWRWKPYRERFQNLFDELNSR